MGWSTGCWLITILVILVAEVAVTATPPGILIPSNSHCDVGKFKICKNLVHVCPKFCGPSGGCTTECQSCKPICNDGTFPPPGSDDDSPPTPVDPPITHSPPPPTESNDDSPPTPVSPPITHSPPPPTPVSPPITHSPPPPTPVSPPITHSPPPPTPVSPPITHSSPPPTPVSPPITHSPPPPTPVNPPITHSPPPPTESDDSPPTPISPPITHSPPPPAKSDDSPPTPVSPPITHSSPPPPTPISPPITHSPPPPPPPTPISPPITHSPPPPTESNGSPPAPVNPPITHSPPPPTESDNSPPTPVNPPPSSTPPTPSSTPTPTTKTPPKPPSTPTPPSSDSSGKKRAKCKIESSECYNVEYTCPDDCPGGCQVNCKSCKPVCKCDVPGAVCQDPRFIGADGITFYFHGKKDKEFCLVSDTNLHINGHFIGKRDPTMTRDFTWVQSIAILFNNHKIFLGAKKTSSWHDLNDRLAITFDEEPIFLQNREGANWPSEYSSSPAPVSITRITSANTVIVEAEGNFRITVKVVPITEEDSRIHNYGITGDDCFAHLELNFKFFALSGNVDGVLGRTYASDYVSKVNVSKSMPVVGGESEFVTSSLFSPDCSASRFGGGDQKVSGGGLGMEFPSLTCGGDHNEGGAGVVCKR